ncbi:MAG TPA: CBS domain-containing protein [Verrucomicrobiae bacterium]|jgi:CBS domain-containing protein
MRIKEVITPEPLCISPDTTVLEAAENMKAMDVGILLICENDHIIGTITDRDITVRAIARGCDPKTTKVCEVMSGEIIYCLEEHDVEDVAEIMEKGRVRRLSVLNKDKSLVGIISLGDLAARANEAKIAGRVLARISMPTYVAQ